MISLVVNNTFKTYEICDINGYKFKPRNKYINTLTIIDNNYIKKILTKKIQKDIKRATKTIKLMLKSNVTEISDCNIMLEELNRVAKNIEFKYMKYFNELEYFELVKTLYFLNMEITAKKKLLEAK